MSYTMREIYCDGYNCGYRNDGDTDGSIDKMSLERDEREHWWEGYEYGQQVRQREDNE